MQPLRGVRVLDLSRLLPGPFATLVLADLGASVDKIEDAQGGDYLRHMPPQVAGESAAFQLLNRGKRSLVLDLKKAEGRAAFLRLALRYDVLFEQFRPGVLARLGLGHDELRAQNPRLIICALTGYGQTGPLASRAGHDLNYLARAGVLGAQGPSDGPPAVPGFQMADVSGGLWSVISILAALAERELTGVGTTLDVAMTDGVLGFASTTLAAALAGLTTRRGDETLSGGIAPYNTYLAKDGTPMALAALEPKFWMAFCAAVGLEASMEALMPGPHQVALKQRVAAIIAGKTRDEWMAFVQPLTHMTDRELVQLVCAFRLMFPDAGLVLSTREPARLRDGLIPLGITLMSAGSHTEPGGYTGAGREKIHQTVRGKIVELGASEWATLSVGRASSQAETQNGGSSRASPHQTNATGQFEISDDRSPREVAELIRKLGYEPVWKDWDAALTA